MLLITRENYFGFSQYVKFTLKGCKNHVEGFVLTTNSYLHLLALMLFQTLKKNVHFQKEIEGIFNDV